MNTRKGKQIELGNNMNVTFIVYDISTNFRAKKLTHISFG